MQLEVSFQKFLSHRAEKPETKVEIMCFFEELDSRVGGNWIGKVCRLNPRRVMKEYSFGVDCDRRISKLTRPSENLDTRRPLRYVQIQ